MAPKNLPLKAQLLAQAEAVLETLLQQQPDPKTATLAEIEAVVLQAGQAFTQALTQTLVEQSAPVVAPAWPVCAQCGRRLQAKGRRKRRVVTRTGDVALARDYYHCRVCHTGVFPPG